MSHEEKEGKDETSYDALTWVSAHPDGKWIVVGDFAGRILVWEPRRGRIVGKQKLDGRVLRVEWTSDGKRLLAIGEGSDALHVFEADASKVVRTIATGHDQVFGLAAHPSKARAATTGRDGHARIWDLDAESAAAAFDLKASAGGMVCALSEEYLAVGTNDGQFDVFDLSTEKNVAGGEVFSYTYVSAIAFSPDGKWLVMGGGKGKMLVFATGGKWTCRHEWRTTPPKPIATNCMVFARDSKTWVAAHSDDTASLMTAPADPYASPLGSAFYLDRKPWEQKYIVSAACFVPDAKVIVTSHFDGRLRVFTEKLHLRGGEVAFDPKTDAPVVVKALFEAKEWLANHHEEKKETKQDVSIGDKEHRARSIAEMRFAASLHPCVTCGSAPSELSVSGEGDTRTLRGSCRFCGTKAAFTFFVEGDPSKMRPKRFELGDDRPSTMIEPRALTAELERLNEVGIDDTNRERALTCVVELLKFGLIREGERGDGLRAERDRLLSEVKGSSEEDAKDGRVRVSPSFASMTQAMFFDGKAPDTIAAIEEALGIRVELAEPSKVMPNFAIDVALEGLVSKVSLVLAGWIYSWRPIGSMDDARERPLREWIVTMQSGADEIIAALRRAYGPPRVLPNHHVYGEKWTVATRGQAVQLGSYSKLPDWAAPPVDPALRERALVELARAVNEARDGAELTRVVASLPQGCGIAPRDSGATEISLELVPAMRVLDFARVMGWPEVLGRSRDMHGAHHHVYVPSAAGGEPLHPKIGRFTVEIAVEGRPTGEVIGGKNKPIFAWIHRFGPDDLVRYWRIHG